MEDEIDFGGKRTTQENTEIQEENNDIKSDVYTDFMDLVKDIGQHIRENPNAVIFQNDDPMRMRIGYEDGVSGKCWFISIERIRMSLNEDIRELTIRALQTEEGKKAIIDSFYGDGKDREQS